MAYKVVDSEVLDNGLHGIADKIREKSGTAEELVFPEGFENAVDSIVGSKEEEEKTLSVTKNGNYEVIPEEGKAMSKVNVDVNVAFEGDIGKPYIDTSKMNYFSSFIYQNPLLVDDIKNIDVTNGTEFSSMFQNSRIEIVPPLNTIKGVRYRYMFYSCSNLKEIQGICLKRATDIDSMVKQCPKLETLYFTEDVCEVLPTTKVLEVTGCTNLKNIRIPKEWKNSIVANYSKVITVESLHGMIENLADLTGQTAQIFQVGATNLAKIDAEHLAMLQNKNWNYS